MRLDHIPWCAALALAGCSNSVIVPAAANRVLAVPDSALAGTPICFAPPNPALSLSMQAEYNKVVSACQSAAVRQNVRVAPIANGGCLVATMTWGSGATGARIGTCERNWDPVSASWGGWSATCESDAVYLKYLRLILAEPGKSVAAETTASIKSLAGGVSDQTYFALCTAAFHGYPHPLSAKFDVTIE